MADTKEKPIPLKPHEVRGILDGRQSQLRRIMKGVNAPSTSIECKNGIATISTLFGAGPGHPVCERVAFKKCPYGQPGDRLWIRETFAIVPRSAYAQSVGVEQVVRPNHNHDAAIFRAGFDRADGGIRWRPSIHMPRWASRILLEVTGVRVERLQDISGDDAFAEGVRGEPCDHKRQSCKDIGCYGDSAKGAYRGLWESLNGPGSWEANPWVWVIGFKVVEVKG